MLHASLGGIAAAWFPEEPLTTVACSRYRGNILGTVNGNPGLSIESPNRGH